MKSLHISFLFISLTSFHLHAKSLQVTQAMQNLSPTHPRLFLNQKGEADLKAKIARNPSLQPLADRIVETAAEFLTLPPVERELEGRRLLDVSRTALSRITHLSMAYRLTGEKNTQEEPFRK